MAPKISGPEHEKEIESLKLIVRVVIYSKNIVAKKKHIDAYLDHLTRLVNTNKHRNDEPIDGARSLDDMYLDIITRNHISSVGSQFQKDITTDEEPFYIETEAPCDLEPQPYSPQRPQPYSPQRLIPIVQGQAVEPLEITTQAPCDKIIQPSRVPVPTVNIEANNNNISKGESVTLTLTIEDADGGELTGYSVNASGAEVTETIIKNVMNHIALYGNTHTVQPETTTLYTLVAWNSNDKIFPDSITINVDEDIPQPQPLPPIPTVEIQATNINIFEGDSTDLNLKIRDAVDGYIFEANDDGTLKTIIADNITSDKIVTVSPRETTIYKLIAWNDVGDEASDAIIIDVSEVPEPPTDPEPEPIAELKADPLFIDPGGSVSLTPRFANGTPKIYTQIDTDVGKTLTSLDAGQQLISGMPFDVQPFVNTRYILIVSNSYNKVKTESVYITINTQVPPLVLQPQPEPTAELISNKDSVHEGTDVILTPKFADGIAAIYAGETLLYSSTNSSLKSNSPIYVKPQVSTTYILRVHNGKREKTADVFIRVVPRETQHDTKITANRILVNPGDLVILTPTFTSGQAKIYETKELNGRETTQQLQEPILTDKGIEVRPQVSTTYLLYVTDNHTSDNGSTIKHLEGSSVTVNIKKPLIQQQATEFVINMDVPC
jgi:hypothetical protein